MDIKRIAQSSEFAQSLETDQTKPPEKPVLPNTLDPTNIVEKFEPDDEVVVAFQQGDFAQPFVTGNLWKGDSPPTEADAKNTFNSALNGEATTGDLVSCMMAYLKMATQENRQDHEITKADKNLDLASKDAQLENDNQAIDQAKDEAGEKFNAAFGEAAYEMLIGAFSSLQSSDHSEQLNQMGDMLDQLRAAKTGLLSEMSEKQNPISVTTSLIQDWIRHHKPD